MGDAHEVIVDNDRKVVGRETVRFEDHLIVRHRRVDPASDEVGEGRLDVVGDVHPHDRRLEKPGGAARSSRVLPRQSRS